MKLDILERLVALDILPKQGDYTTLKIVEKMRLSLSFTEEEFKKWEIKSEGGKTTWKVNGEEEIPFGEKATDIMIEALKAKSKSKSLAANAISLYEKFIPS